MFKIYKAETETQTEKTLKRLRSDQDGEYTLNEMVLFCQEYGIIHEVTSYFPLLNGVAERKNHTLMDMVNSMLINLGAPENLWWEAVLAAYYILNRIPFKNSNKIPFELWKGRTPRLG